MRVLVTGAAGQLGTEVSAYCTSVGDEVLALDHQMLDVSDRDQVMAAVSHHRPDAVMHCGAWTAVDACESDGQKAFLMNALAVRWVSDACRRFDAHLVHISTDYVFSGDKPSPYTEWDVPDPASVYGYSKLAGESEAGPAATIVRTSWVCSEHGSNMVKTILRAMDTQPELRFVDDQRGCPTFTSDLAPMLRRLALDRRSGLHHVTNQGSVSWFDFARAVVVAAGGDAEMVSPIATADLVPARPAPRPANSVLDNAVLRLSGLPLLPDFRQTLPRVVTSLCS